MGQIARRAVVVRQIMGRLLGQRLIPAASGTGGVRAGTLCVTVLLAALPVASEAAWTAVNEGLSTGLAAASDGTRYVAVGSAGEIHYTQDGLTWTKATGGDALGRLLRGVVWSGSQFVAVGDYCAADCSTAPLLTSPDGATWTSRSSSTSANLNGVASSGSVYVAVGSGGRIIRSTDAITWSIVTSGTTNNLYGVTYGDGQFVAVGASATVLTSPDGSAWTVESGVPGTSTLRGVADFGGVYVIVGSGGVLTTSDFVTWAQPLSADLTAVALSGGLAAAIGTASIYTSTDGTT
jgi:hypothetical protein